MISEVTSATEARWGVLRLASFLLLLRSPGPWRLQQVAQPHTARLIPRKWRVYVIKDSVSQKG